jgi:hypothetical protein
MNGDEVDLDRHLREVHHTAELTTGVTRRSRHRRRRRYWVVITMIVMAFMPQSSNADNFEDLIRTPKLWDHMKNNQYDRHHNDQNDGNEEVDFMSFYDTNTVRRTSISAAGRNLSDEDKDATDDKLESTSHSSSDKKKKKKNKIETTKNKKRDSDAPDGEVCQPIEACQRCTYSEQKSYKACQATGRWMKYQCTKPPSSSPSNNNNNDEEDQQQSVRNEMRSCQYTQSDEEFAMVS